MKKCGCHSVVKVFPFNIFIVSFSNKSKVIFLEGCSLTDLSAVFLVTLFFTGVIHTDIHFGQFFHIIMLYVVQTVLRKL